MVWIPLEASRTLSEAVIDSLGDKHTTVSSKAGEGLNKSQNIWVNRYVIYKEFLKGSDQFLRMQDGNILHTRIGNYELMEEFLKANEDYGWVALYHVPGMVPKRVGPGHVYTKCVVIRRACLKDLPLQPYYRECNCNTIRREAVENGWKVGYLSNRNNHITVKD